MFFKVVDEVEAIVKKKGWSLEKKYNKHYMGFKAGFPNVFGIQWISTKPFGFFFKVAHDQLQKVQEASPYELKYDERWKQATLKCDDKVDVKKLEPVLEKIHDMKARIYRMGL